jgi:predicted amidohydrolase YtcJ
VLTDLSSRAKLVSSSRSSALSFTRNPAVAMGLGDITGALRPGLSADFAVLDRDPFTVDPDEIARTVVAQTWFEGRRMYEHAL